MASNDDRWPGRVFTGHRMKARKATGENKMGVGAI